MKIKKMSFADIENTMCKEEMKCIMGGSGSGGSVGGGSYNTNGSLMYGGSNPPAYSGAGGYYGNTQGWATGFTVPSSGGSSSSSGGGGGSSSYYTPGWTDTGRGIVTSDPNVIKRIVDYLDWERVILKNEPTITQVNNFVNMDYLTGGKGILSDGSILAQSMTITHDPYGEFKTIESLSRIFQNFGDSLTIGGAALSTTGVGAIVGAPMMAIGGGISKVGTVAELYLDLKSTEPFDYAKWGIKAGLNFAPDVYTQLFSKRAGAVGFDKAMVEMYSVASDRWFDYMGTVRK
ncbi:hypothetical protein [Flavobacterium sp. ov086]|uniref:hypothetical protein n=1 Tax=Flavobacterium sp. ov086 TaxID=1761785 RepID=UPI000B6CE563|nr:hypothetical protein [Flavobacterium sp. ov086]SNR60590.1 hypothetical protein SAMN04487979_11356 [Flavobacterium sp. ov086]